MNETDLDEMPYELRDIPDEDDTDCGPSEEDLDEFEYRAAA